ncbi:MAG: hypothetical protein LBT05_08050 [Planctomycetaceae bacterium]|jgi:hypothetical protein|nr:hypothetical protein [Planctomycetaceae bacterium]
MTQLSMFDTEKQLEKIYEINDFLPKLSVFVDFEHFRPLIDQHCPVKPQPKDGKSPTITSSSAKFLSSNIYLSDEQTELQIHDRLSFQHFLGLTRADKIPASF